MGLSGWERADARVRASHQQALNGDVPLVALSTFARWWQFETWLRSLLYLELHAADGLRWESRIGSTTRRRAKADAQNAYMASPDAGSLLAYLDVADLFALIDDDGTWPLVKDALVPRPRWRGVVAQIGPVRHRLAHARRPHADDLGRLEQVLRDLETGARRAVGAYFETYDPPKTDPLTAATTTDEFTHLTRHVEHNYEIDFRLSYSLRPWAKRPTGSQVIAGRPGALWHARFYFRGERLLRPEVFWPDYKIEEPRDSGLIVHAVFPSPKELIVTFAAV